MAKDFVVIQTSNNCRISKVPAVIAEFKGKSNCAFNPKLTHLRGIPPHHWKVQNNKVFRKDPFERKAVNTSHQINGVNNDLTTIEAEFRIRWMFVAYGVGVLALIAAIIYWGGF